MATLKNNEAGTWNPTAVRRNLQDRTKGPEGLSNEDREYLCELADDEAALRKHCDDMQFYDGYPDGERFEEFYS
jgi:hypothetical protein